MKTPSALQTLLTQAYESEKHLRHFSMLASQELTTLLATIVGELETARTTEGQKKLQHQIQLAEEAATKAIFWTKNFRYFTAGISPKLTLTDLSQSVFHCLQAHEAIYKKLNIEVDAQIEDSIFTLADPYAIEQALMNLFVFPTQPLLSVAKLSLSLRLLPAGVQFSFEVFSRGHDSLVGKPSQFRPLPLESVRSEAVPMLGLQVCNMILEAHSGKLTCFQSSNEDLEFLLELPFDARTSKPHLFHEKRRFPRVVVDLPAQLKPKGQKPLLGQVTVLSLGGAFVAVSHERLQGFRVGESVALTIAVDASSQIEVPKARIANMKHPGENSGVGLEFLELDVKSKNLLAALVKAHAS